MKDLCINCEERESSENSDYCQQCMNTRLDNYPEWAQIELQNIGAGITSNLLKEIADTGQHHGTFGGEEVEACAQSILKLHKRIEELERQISLDNDMLK
jgi:hypothetical protein